MIAIIGGTGINKILKLNNKETITTPYGTAEVMRNDKIVLLLRHGEKHTIPPHKINYRANIYALKKLGVERILSINSVGSLNLSLKPGTFFIPNDFMEFTKKREETFYEDRVVHIDLTYPFCPELIKVLKSILDKNNFEYSEGTYICTEGPRFETKKEISFYKTLGDVVGMTLYPEVVLARELEMCYVSICNITNYACGISKNPLTVEEVLKKIDEMEKKILKVVDDFVNYPFGKRECICKDAIKLGEIK